MAAADYFTWEWKELSGNRYLYVTSNSMADDERWGEFFEEISDSFQSPNAFILVDVRGKEERIGLNGFKTIIEYLRLHGIRRAIFSVLSDDNFHDLTADVFKRLSEMQDFDLSINVSLTQSTAEIWLENNFS